MSRLLAKSEPMHTKQTAKTAQADDKNGFHNGTS